MINKFCLGLEASVTPEKTLHQPRMQVLAQCSI